MQDFRQLPRRQLLFPTLPTRFGNKPRNTTATPPVATNSAEDSAVDCIDLLPDDCPGWAASGECKSNPVAMLTQCPVSCSVCVPTPVSRNSGSHERHHRRIGHAPRYLSCVDQEDQCAVWTTQPGGCSSEVTRSLCPAVCDDRCSRADGDVGERRDKGDGGGNERARRQHAGARSGSGGHSSSRGGNGGGGNGGGNGGGGNGGGDGGGGGAAAYPSAATGLSHDPVGISALLHAPIECPVVTASSDREYVSLRKLASDVQRALRQPLVVYSRGLSSAFQRSMRSWCKVTVEQLSSLLGRGSMSEAAADAGAWRPLALHRTASQHGCALWLDPTARLLGQGGTTLPLLLAAAAASGGVLAVLSNGKVGQQVPLRSGWRSDDNWDGARMALGALIVLWWRSGCVIARPARGRL